MYKLKYLRESELLTQKQIAEKIDCGHRAYAYYEENKRDIPTAVLIQLAELYDVSTDYILDRTECPKSSPTSSVASYQFAQIRKSRSLSQKEVAEALFIAQNTYSCYENSTRDIPNTTLIRLADFYDVSVDYILGRTDNPKLNK